MRNALSLIAASSGFLPKRVSGFLVANILGKSCSRAAVDATCSHVLQYHTMRNVLFMAMTGFKKLSEALDWKFLRENRDKIAFLYGANDHWAPMQMFEEISKNVPEITILVEEGHVHAFSCTKTGSDCVAQHVKRLIETKISKNVPEIPISVEKSHLHAFSCTEAGSDCVAQHVVRLIEAKVESSNK